MNCVKNIEHIYRKCIHPGGNTPIVIILIGRMGVATTLDIVTLITFFAQTISVCKCV